MKKLFLRSLSDMAFWRKNRASVEPGKRPETDLAYHQPDNARSEKARHTLDTAEHEKDWLYVGKDEEGTPIYLDRRRMTYSPISACSRVWLKYVPSQGATSFKQAREYLAEAGIDYRGFSHVEQLLELDIGKDMIADLVLLFFDRDDHLIEQVQFNKITFRPLGPEPVYAEIRKIVAGKDDKPQPLPDAKPSQEQPTPTIDDKIQTKLQEINAALDAFDKS